MSFASIAIKTSIPGTAPAATSGALTFSTIEDENWLQIIGDASAGSGSLYLLRWNPDLAVWHPYISDKPITVDSAAFNGLFSAAYPFPKGEESFVLYDPTGTITATASAARTGSPLVAPAPASSGASGGATEAKQDVGNASLVSILGQLDAKTSTLATETTLSAAKTLLGAGLPASLVGGKLDVNLGTSSITLPVSGPLTDVQLRAVAVPVSGTITVTSTTANQGTGAAATAPWSVELSDGTAFYTGAKTGQFPTTLGQTTKAASLSVAIASDQTVPISGTVTVSQATGSGSAATFWYVRGTDGTNTTPTMDVAARSGYQRVTDGTNTAAVKAASTVPTASDTALVVSLSPNSKNPGGSSFAWFSTATGSTIKSGAGVVRRVIIGSNVTGTVTLYDNTAASGTVICSVTSTTSTPCNYVELNAAFSTGLHCVTTGSGISVTVVYD